MEVALFVARGKRNSETILTATELTIVVTSKTAFKYFSLNAFQSILMKEKAALSNT